MIFNLRTTMLFLVLFTFQWASAAHYSQSEVIDLLDQTIAKRSEYHQQKEQHIDDLRRLFRRADPSARIKITNELCHEFWGFNTDSARFYAQQWIELAQDPHWGDVIELQHAKIYQSRCLAVNGLYEDAKQILLPIEPELYAENRHSYWNAKCEIYVWEAEFSPLPNAWDTAYPIATACHDSILTSPSLAPEIRKHEQALLSRDWQERNRLILPVLDTISIDNPTLRYLANNAGSNYERQQMTDSAIYYYALSAISDLRQSVREYASLSSLALLLYKEGDVKRAYRYITTSLEDAEQCGAQMRTVSMARGLPLIIQSYHQHILRQQNWLVAGLIVSGILLICLFFMLYRLIKVRHRLKDAHSKLLRYQDDLKQNKRQIEQANKKLKASNLSLHESNHIKQTYVASYMKQCSATIAKIENYRLMLQKTALSSNYGKLVSTIKETNVIDKELEDFYRSFDETFLSLFPTFITDFNALLRPEEQLPTPERNRLSTELRIFALIRLGINDSEEIADFLRYSIKTIYNYRTRIRNKALCDRSELEAELMKIGSEAL